MKAVIKEKFITSNAYIRKEERSKINYLSTTRETTDVGKDAEKGEPILLVGMQTGYSLSGKQFGGASKKLKIKSVM